MKHSDKYFMTIVFPADPMGPKVGGAETFLRGLIQYAPENIEVKYIGVSCNKESRPAKKWSTENINGREFMFYPVFIELNEDKKRIIPLSLRFVLANPIRTDFNNDVVLVHNRMETVISKNTDKYNNIIFIHNDIAAQIGQRASEVLWSKFPWLYFWFEKLIFKKIQNVFTVSTASLKLYNERYSFMKNKFSFIPTWVDTSIFYPASKSKNTLRCEIRELGVKFNNDGKWVLFVGRLQKQKAPERLINAFYSLLQIQPDARLILAGDGNLRSQVEDQIKELGLGDKVQLLGAVTPQIIRLCYQSSDVLALSSNFEGMPICVLESLACGLPVVSTNVGEISRVVKSGVNGEIVENKNDHDIAQALFKVLNNQQRYNEKNCVQEIEMYSPLNVLTPVYHTIKNLSTKKMVNDVR